MKTLILTNKDFDKKGRYTRTKTGELIYAGNVEIDVTKLDEVLFKCIRVDGDMNTECYVSIISEKEIHVGGTLEVHLNITSQEAGIKAIDCIRAGGFIKAEDNILSTKGSIVAFGEGKNSFGHGINSNKGSIIAKRGCTHSSNEIIADLFIESRQIQAGGNLVCLNGHIISGGGISCDGDIICGGNIKAESYLACTDNIDGIDIEADSIQAEIGIHSGGSICARRYLMAGGGASAKQDITIGETLSVGMNIKCGGDLKVEERIFAGVSPYATSYNERLIECAHHIKGEVCYGELMENQ